jgi:DNA-binding transcriptional regulator YdaS (Cro superfamily)
MNKKHAIELAGDTKKLAQILGITVFAIYQWGEEVPKMRVFQLMALKPEWFKQ